MRNGSSHGSRAFGLGFRRAVMSAIVLGALAAAIVALLSSGGSSSTAGARGAKYGGLPAWLPQPKTKVGRVLNASSSHPALTIQGEALSVHIHDATVLATAAGPSVPEEGRTPVPQTSPCTFVLTLAHATHAVRIDPGAFHFIDQDGHVRRARVAALDGGPAPREVPPGRTVSLRLSDVLPTGDGALTWTPTGKRPIASWDFDVEID